MAAEFPPTPPLPPPENNNRVNVMDAEEGGRKYYIPGS